MDFGEIVGAVAKIFELITNTPAGATLSVIGLILLILGVVIAVIALKSTPRKTPTWVKAGLFFCLIGGVSFSAMGPAVALLSLSKYSIIKVSPKKAFDNLETNERIFWLIRLIPFDPQKTPDLAIGKLDHLGPPSQQFTFVGAYDELVGYGVDDAIRMIGGIYNSEERVSAIIFPVAGRQLYPANTRGLLQTIQKIESNNSNKIDKFFLKGTGALRDNEIQDLPKIDGLVYWRWKSYGALFPRYCELTQKFRCDSTYSARTYLGDLNIDWHPLGFAQRNVDKDSCSEPAASYCSIPDWRAAETALLDHFGARIFLIENLSINSIANRVLIDFGNPTNQLIPDIGFRTSRH